MSQKRYYFFDNAKFILIILVIFAHFLESIISDSRALRSLYILIYSFHMPAFIFIAGYFSKVKSDFFTYTIYNFKKLLLPYIIFQIFYLGVDSFLFANDFEITLIRPYWIMWFLLSLFFWRLILFLINKIKLSAFWSIFISFIGALGVGFFTNFSRFYSASRTFVFLPFFLIAYFIKDYNFAKIIKKHKSEKFKILSTLILFFQFLLIYLYFHNLDLEFLYGAVPYSYFINSLSTAFFGRIIFILTAILNIILFFIIVPAEKINISSLGKRSIYPYLLHGFIALFLEKSGYFNYINSYLVFILILFSAIFSGWILSSKFTRNIFKTVIEF